MTMMIKMMIMIRKITIAITKKNSLSKVSRFIFHYICFIFKSLPLLFLSIVNLLISLPILFLSILNLLPSNLFSYRYHISIIPDTEQIQEVKSMKYCYLSLILLTESDKKSRHSEAKHVLKMCELFG